MGATGHRWARIAAVRGYLPERVVTNEELSSAVGWPAEKIFEKTGIASRRVAGEDECVSDMAVAAADRLFADCGHAARDAQFLILCTQTPDHQLPTTACLVQQRLGLPAACAAFDINQGCSGYVYALGIASAFIRSGMFERGLVITADTYSRLIHPGDRSVRTLFGDGAAATWVEGAAAPGLECFEFGTDGAGAANLLVPAGGTRLPHSIATAQPVTDPYGNVRSQDNLYMNGPEILAFAMKRVPPLVRQTLEAGRVSAAQVDWFVFHQANRFMLDYLRSKLELPAERMIYFIERVGNTVSSSIPLALEDCLAAGRFESGDRILLAGFGVGYSWGAALMTWGGET